MGLKQWPLFVWAPPDDTGGEPPEGEPTGAPAAPETQPQGQEPEADEFEALPEGQTVFGRTYVEQLRKQAADYRTGRRELASQLETWGGPEQVSAAINLWQAAQTADGVGRIFVEAGQQLGIPADRLMALVRTPQPAAPAAEEEDLDQPLTRRQLQELLEREVRAPLAATQEQMTFSRNQSAIDGVLKDLGVTDPREANVVLELGDRYVSPEETRADALIAAVRKGHADFQKLLDTRGQDYLRKKAETGRKASGALQGGAPAGTEVPPEPKNMQEAHERARQRLAAAGLE